MQKEKGAAVRTLLDRLGYDEYTPKWQFGKQLDPSHPDLKVKVDLLSRTPEAGEGVRIKGPRVGSGAGIDLLGRDTPEAFAVEDGPISFPVSGMNSEGKEVSVTVTTPHPYAALNMKVTAAHDWLLRQRGEMAAKAGSEKHVFDVYALTASMTQTELAEAAQRAERYRGHPIAEHVRGYAVELFGTATSPGVPEVRRQIGRDLDYSLFWEVLTTALGL